MKHYIKNFFFLLLLSVLIVSCNTNSKENTLTIFNAGSLSKPLKKIAEGFKSLHPNVKIEMESSGSIDCVRKITELGRECDVLASADYTVIDQLMIPDFAEKNIPFAGNEMTLVYRKESKFSQSINDTNWYEILLRPDVYIGRSDPNADPCGYRTILTLQLAQKYYSNDGSLPFEIEQFTSKDNRFIRPKEVDLLSLLESGAVDYIFIYKSVAIQHHLNYLELPKEINLGDPNLKELYSSVEVSVRGSKPGEVLTIKGTPILYSITIPKCANNPKLAQEFIDYLLSESGDKVFEEMGQKVSY